ncbi:hypothetical protein ACM6VE_004548 [Vibrio parahaemolyticus]|nr:hypothetical protein [Vibrio parahaemolyticus]HAS6966848.1 hypothetical protein [Vibrio parahaemolyticus]
MDSVINYLSNNYTWVFSGLGISVIGIVWKLLSRKKEGGFAVDNVHSGRDVLIAQNSQINVSNGTQEKKDEYHQQLIFEKAGMDRCGDTFKYHFTVKNLGKNITNISFSSDDKSYQIVTNDRDFLEHKKQLKVSLVYNRQTFATTSINMRWKNYLGKEASRHIVLECKDYQIGKIS